MGELIAEATGGDYGLPGQSFEVVEVQVRKLGDLYNARAQWMAGSNQGYIETHWRREVATVSSDPFQAVRELRGELREIGAPAAESAEACSLALSEIAETLAHQDGNLERATTNT